MERIPHHSIHGLNGLKFYKAEGLAEIFEGMGSNSLTKSNCAELNRVLIVHKIISTVSAVLGRTMYGKWYQVKMNVLHRNYTWLYYV